MQGVNHFCERHPLGGPDHELDRLGIAIKLSGGDIRVCEALLRGETVPASLLQPEQVKRLK
jgi:hypothetical protein